MKGITVTVCDGAQSFPNAYYKAGAPMATYFTAEHNGKEWVITDIYRTYCRGTVAQIALTDDAKAAIIASKERYC